MITAADVLNNVEWINIGMCKDNVPYVIPMNFSWENVGEDIVLYIHTGRKGKKFDMLKEGAEVCITAAYAGGIRWPNSQISCRTGYNFRSIVSMAKVNVIEDREKKIHALDLLMEKIAKKPGSYSDAQIEKVNIIALTLFDTGVKDMWE